MNNENDTRIWLDDMYAIHRYKGLTLWYLEYYRFGKKYMPEEIYADNDYGKVYSKYLKEMR